MELWRDAGKCAPCVFAARRKASKQPRHDGASRVLEKVLAAPRSLDAAPPCACICVCACAAVHVCAARVLREGRAQERAKRGGDAVTLCGVRSTFALEAHVLAASALDVFSTDPCARCAVLLQGLHRTLFMHVGRPRPGPETEERDGGGEAAVSTSVVTTCSSFFVLSWRPCFLLWHCIAIPPVLGNARPAHGGVLHRVWCCAPPPVRRCASVGVMWMNGWGAGHDHGSLASAILLFHR